MDERVSQDGGPGPSVAGMTDAARGGRNRRIDHEAVVAFARKWPLVPAAAPDDEEFPFRATRHAVAEFGLRQFLNLGCGKPLAEGRNLHSFFPGNWLHVDADPEIRDVGRALFSGGSSAFLEADIRNVDGVLGSDEAGRLLDLDEPVCVLATNVWHYAAGDEPAAAMRAYLGAVAPGSVLVFAHACGDGLDGALLADLNEVFGATFAGGIWPRSESEIRGFLGGLELLEPGLVSPQDWRPDHAPVVPVKALPILGCVAVKG